MIKYKNPFISFLMQNISLHVSSNSHNSHYTYLADIIKSFVTNHYNSEYEIHSISNYVVLKSINNNKSEKFNYTNSVT